MPQTSQKQMPTTLKLGDRLRVDEEIDVDVVLEALENWIEDEVYKVLVEEGSGVGVVWSVDKSTGEVEKEVTKCPPLLVNHLRQLMFNRERAGRYTFYFVKSIAELLDNEVPLWIEFAAKELASRKGKKKGKNAGTKQATTLRKKWRTQLAQFVMFQGKQLIFFHGALNHIIVELKNRINDEDDTSAWEHEAWLHNVFMEYIVRNRWEAFDTNEVNDGRWAKARDLNPIHPKNKLALGTSYIMPSNVPCSDRK
jgi:hypothetical protein